MVTEWQSVDLSALLPESSVFNGMEDRLCPTPKRDDVNVRKKRNG